MVITRISKQKNKPRLFALELDGTYAFDVSDTVLLRYNLRSGEDVEEERMTAIKAAALEEQAQSIAINYVSYRPRSSREVVNHLIRKGIEKQLAESVVHRFETVNLINNLEFSRMFVRDKLRRKPTGKSLLQKLLAAKGISSPTIEQVLRENITDEDQNIAAKELASRRLRLTKRSMARLDPLKQKQRLTGYLLRHGFSNDVVQKTIHALFHR